MGFRNNEHFCLLGTVGHFEELDAVDSWLGYSRGYDEVPGFKIFEGGEEAYKILILGGSNSDSALENSKSWPEYLYEKLKNNDYKVTIINGAIGGYATGQEFLKLVRDGIGLKPDMCITFDGLNDIAFVASDKEYPFLSPYGKKVWNRIVENGKFAPDTLGMRNISRVTHGLVQKDEDWERYIRCMRQIHAVAKEFEIEHVGFFQPMILTGKAIIDKRVKNMMKVNAVQRLEKMLNFYCKVKSWVEKTNYMYDLTDIFDNKRDMYYDYSHATDEGNEVIANAIFEIIVDKMEVQ